MAFVVMGVLIAMSLLFNTASSPGVFHASRTYWYSSRNDRHSDHKKTLHRLANSISMKIIGLGQFYLLVLNALVLLVIDDSSRGILYSSVYLAMYR